MKAVFLWCGALLASLPRAVISVSLCVSGGVQAADEEAPAMNEIPSRPVPLFNRWEEDWSALADERVPRQPFDDLKYLSLSSIDRLVYLSLGANVRERFEALNPQAFGTRSNRERPAVLRRRVGRVCTWGLGLCRSLLASGTKPRRQPIRRL
jgi:hypothetical protein